MLTLLLFELIVGPFYRALVRRRSPPLTPAQRWAIAAGGDLARLNGSSLTTLHTPKLPGTSRHTLYESWGISEASTTRAQLTGLEQGGHRVAFRKVYASLASVRSTWPSGSTLRTSRARTRSRSSSRRASG